MDEIEAHNSMQTATAQVPKHAHTMNYIAT